MGELSRMTQIKDKTQNKQNDSVGAGLFNYPVLMAADILLYNADLVPIGADQKQHLELTRDIALRFNRLYGDVFTVPEPYIGKMGARVMSLQNPHKKMSKSDENPKAYISITEEPGVILKKIKSAVTDSGASVSRGEGKEGVENLMSIMSACSGKDFDTIENEYSGKNYGVFKNDVAECVIEELRPILDTYKRIKDDKSYLEKVYKDGAAKASYIAGRTMRKVFKKVGFTEK
jgi:tryptophanyl-tRNA synthetase